MQFKYSLNSILSGLILPLFTVSLLFLVNYSKDHRLFFMIPLLVVVIIFPIRLYQYLKVSYVKITEREMIVSRGILTSKKVKLDSIKEIITNNKKMLLVLDSGKFTIFESFIKKNERALFYNKLKEATKLQIKYDRYLSTW